MSEKKLNVDLIVKDAYDRFKKFIEIDLKEILDDNTIDKIKNHILLMKFVPASTNHHGSYPGGLYDHTLLVFYFSDKLYDVVNPEFSRRDVMLIALLHDLEKLFSRRFNIPEKYKSMIVTIQGRDEVSANNEMISLMNEFTGKKFYGHDWHTEKTYAMIRKMGITLKSEQVHALAHHHGGWSNFKCNNSIDSRSMSAYLHAADMLAAFTLNT